MLKHSDVSARLPAQDLSRAKAFYADKLGLTPIEERPDGLRYQCGNGSFSLFQSSGKPAGNHTQVAWEVDDIQATVAELQAPTWPGLLSRLALTVRFRRILEFGIPIS